MIAKISDLADVQGGMVLSRKEAKNQKESAFEYSRLTLRAFDENGNINKSELEIFHACENLENALFTEVGDVVIRLVSPMYPAYIELGYENILVPSQFAILRVKDCARVMPEYLRLCLAQKKCGGTNSQPGKWDSPEDRKNQNGFGFGNSLTAFAYSAASGAD